MIRPPQRAVTRFLIPFIDVLILLFCIFLLMPFVSKPEQVMVDEQKAEEIALLKAQLQKTQTDLEEQRASRSAQFRQFRVIVLDIKADTGELLYLSRESSGRPLSRELIDSEAAAERIISRERARSGDKTVSFLIRFPQEASTYPLLSQLEQYRQWFRNVPLKIDIVTSNLVDE